MNTDALGIIMLDTRFPRPVGDIGHPDSFDCPVLYRRVAGASATQAVRGDVDALLAPFIAVGRELVAEGAVVIGTSCGFLALFQADLAEALGVPVLASALALVPELEVPVGIITIDADALTDRHLKAVGIAEPIPIVGLPRGGELAMVIFEDRPELDMALAEAEMVAAGERLVAKHPEIEHIIFECTNMGPYRDAVCNATGLPVHTVIDALHQEMRR